MTNTTANQEPQAQDLHVSRPAAPDKNWQFSRMQPPSIQPTRERLARLHQIVAIRNTSDTAMTKQGRAIPQVHIVIDRYNRGHEIMPGQTKRDIDMLVSDIAYFVRQRAPNRIDNNGELLLPHPLVVLDVDTSEIENQAVEENERLQAARDAALEREVEAEARQPLRRRRR